MRPSGFDSPPVHLLGLVYDTCCLLALVVLPGRWYGSAKEPTQANLRVCLPWFWSLLPRANGLFVADFCRGLLSLTRIYATVVDKNATDVDKRFLIFFRSAFALVRSSR